MRSPAPFAGTITPIRHVPPSPHPLSSSFIQPSHRNEFMFGNSVLGIPSPQKPSPSLTKCLYPSQIFNSQAPSLSPSPSLLCLVVFGFPSGSSSSVLSRFQKYGEIIGHSVGHGNWLKIEYRDKLAAEQALQQNGKIIHNQYMIGVKPVCVSFQHTHIHISYHSFRLMSPTGIR